MRKKRFKAWNGGKMARYETKYGFFVNDSVLTKRDTSTLKNVEQKNLHFSKEEMA